MGGRFSIHEDTARQLAERDGIEEALVCIFSILEPCRTFKKGGFFVQSARRKCLHLYFYFMDRDFGLIHVRIQTWFPMQIQVYLNGHEWLARKLSANHIRYTKHDNVFLWIEDMAKAQTFADRFASLNWPAILNQYAKRVNPQMRDILHDRPDSWVTAQSEYSTDILFKTRQDLCELSPQLLLIQDGEGKHLVAAKGRARIFKRPFSSKVKLLLKLRGVKHACPGKVDPIVNTTIWRK